MLLWILLDVFFWLLTSASVLLQFRAILGVKAKTIVCIEDGSATEIIKDMVRSVGEEPEIRQFTRLAPLQVATEPIASFRDLQPGDCLIAFGRRHLFGMKAHIEQQLGVKCAIVYGSLPPETRKEQSKLFNDPDSDYKFLVASDAIGMGLNFNIRRVIFSQLHKHDGDLHRQLTTGEIRQIAGRAGRYGTEFGEGGVVTTLGTKKYLEVIRRALDPSVQLPNIEYAYLGISPEEFISFQEQVGGRRRMGEEIEAEGRRLPVKRVFVTSFLNCETGSPLPFRP